MIRTVQKRTVLALLLVEANWLVRLEISRALQQQHFEVLWTTTTEEAVAAYNRRQVDLLLLDLNQPSKVGWDSFKPLGALNPALPIIMVTEKETEVEQEVAERVDARLEKPFSLRALIQTVHLLLFTDKSRAGSQSSAQWQAPSIELRADLLLRELRTRRLHQHGAIVRLIYQSRGSCGLRHLSPAVALERRPGRLRSEEGGR